MKKSKTLENQIHSGLDKMKSPDCNQELQKKVENRIVNECLKFYTDFEKALAEEELLWESKENWESC